MVRTAVLTCLVALVLSPVAAAQSSGGVPSAERVAKRVIERRYDTRIAEIFSIRSRRDRRWALVTVFTRRGTGIAAWLKRTDGVWRVRHTERAHDETRPPRSLRAPCDVQPAFSEPDC